MLTLITGESIVACVLKDLNGLGLDVSNIRGQGYDGASNMSSARVDKEFQGVYLHAVRMAESVGVQPSKPRTCARQRDRSNIVADTVEEWYKLYYRPYHIRFGVSYFFLGQNCIVFILPSLMFTKDYDFTEVVQIYSSDMPSPDLFDQELKL